MIHMVYIATILDFFWTVISANDTLSLLSDPQSFAVSSSSSSALSSKLLLIFLHFVYIYCFKKMTDKMAKGRFWYTRQKRYRYKISIEDKASTVQNNQTYSKFKLKFMLGNHLRKERLNNYLWEACKRKFIFLMIPCAGPKANCADLLAG